MLRKTFTLLASALLIAASMTLPTSSAHASTESFRVANNPCNQSVIASMPGGSFTYVPAYRTNQSCYIERGMENSGVTVLQSALNQCYGFSLETDGVYGNNSRNAIIWLQRRQQLAADGVYGPTTHNYMKWNTFGPERGCTYPFAI